MQSMQPFSKRVKNLGQLMLNKGLNAVVSNDFDDIFYYTGLQLSGNDFALMVISNSGNTDLFISPLVNSAEGLKTARVHFITDFKETRKIIKEHKRVGYDESRMGISMFNSLKNKGTNFYPAKDTIKKPREIKDQKEIASIRKAIKITQSTLRRVKHYGKTEFMLAADIDYNFRRHSAVNAFDTIVSAGKRTSLIHYNPGNKKIGKNDIVLVDCGAKADGYCADITRMFCRKPDERQKALMEDILEIQGKLIDIIEDGVKVETVNEHYERLMEKKGYKTMHGFGHGLGINVHEGPYKGGLKQGMVLTVEPGVYIKGFGGFRFEDVVMVKRGGSKLLSSPVTGF